ncbi:MAG TPA: histidinol-phosphatase HisJ family protein [bacterium]|jgi:histidinol-phosphatase (PHP family)|nr:histidinol-phosphatase HisJ family protein [bacterium]
MRRFWTVAQSVGIDEIGFSEHAYRFRQTEAIWPAVWGLKAVEDCDEYVDSVLALKKEGYPVKLGIEVDFAPGLETLLDNFISAYPWDYVIGAVHFIEGWGFDRPDQAHLWQEKEVVETYRHYFSLFREAIKTRLFDIMAHPDVIKVFGYRPEVPLLTEYEHCAETLLEFEGCYEISTAGLRKPVGEMYPAPEFATILALAELPAVVSSDAHKPEDVGYRFPSAYQYASKRGVNRLARFDNRKRKLLPL